jgi:hypothetical protein
MPDEHPLASLAVTGGAASETVCLRAKPRRDPWAGSVAALGRETGIGAA